MTSDRQAPVAIVGGGFSGTMVAAHLARRSIPAVLMHHARPSWDLHRHRIAPEVAQKLRGGPPAVGCRPLTKERYWEIAAVPDIRGQAAAVAEDIARELGR